MSKKSGCGVYKHLNAYPTVVKNPTRYTGGKNANVTPVMSPTRYTGGKNSASDFEVKPK